MNHYLHHSRAWRSHGPGRRWCWWTAGEPISPVLAGGSAAANQFSVAADEEAHLSSAQVPTIGGVSHCLAPCNNTHQISIQQPQKYPQCHASVVYQYRRISEVLVLFMCIDFECYLNTSVAIYISMAWRLQ